MSEIRPSHLTAIFRSLNSNLNKTDQPNKNKPPIGKTPPPVKKVRNKEVLGAKIRERLGRLSKDDENFKKNASVIAIQEIILWEFGEDVLNHSDYKHIVSTIIKNIQDSKDLQHHLANLINANL